MRAFDATSEDWTKEAEIDRIHGGVAEGRCKITLLICPVIAATCKNRIDSLNFHHIQQLLFYLLMLVGQWKRELRVKGE